MTRRERALRKAARLEARGIRSSVRATSRRNPLGRAAIAGGGFRFKVFCRSSADSRRGCRSRCRSDERCAEKEIAARLVARNKEERLRPRLCMRRRG
jgi:hypothetical protein